MPTLIILQSPKSASLAVAACGLRSLSRICMAVERLLWGACGGCSSDQDTTACEALSSSPWGRKSCPGGSPVEQGTWCISTSAAPHRPHRQPILVAKHAAARHPYPIGCPRQNTSSSTIGGHALPRAGLDSPQGAAVVYHTRQRCLLPPAPGSRAHIPQLTAAATTMACPQQCSPSLPTP